MPIRNLIHGSSRTFALLDQLITSHEDILHKRTPTLKFNSRPSMASCKFLATGTARSVRQWCDLPDDILSRILSLLFGRDFIRFLSVFRSWRSAPPPLRSIPNPYLRATSEASRYPSLFHFSGNSSECQFYDPFYNGSYKALIPDELIDARIYSSNYGWLLMCLGEQIFFFHPFTRQMIHLPVINQPDLNRCGRMCFSSPPTSPDCMVFGIDDEYPVECIVSTLRRGQFWWRHVFYQEYTAKFYSPQSNPVFHNGAFYCSDIDGKLGVYDNTKSEIGDWKILDKLRFPCKSIQETFLVVFDGELVSICMGPIGEYVRVFRLNYDCEIGWEEVHSLGDRMIFASRTCCISMQTDTMGNTIYFPSFDIGGNGLFYSLASRKFHSLVLSSAKNDLYNTKRMLHSVWITPTASEIYTEDDLLWFPNPGNFIPSSGRVTAKAAPQAYPSFVFTSLKDTNNQLLFNMFDRCHNAEGTPEIYRMRTVACAFGWLVQVGLDSWDCLLLNPQTLEKISLPRLPGKFKICAISSPPNDPNCIVLLIHYSGDRIGFAYCRPNENKWTIVVAKKSDDLNYDGISNVIGFQGKIYGLRHNSDLLEIDFDPILNMVRGVWDGVHLPLTSSLGTMVDKTYMVESCGELFTIRINFLDESTVNPSKITEVEVFKLDFARKIWEKVGSLGENIAFFCYGRRCCFSSSSMETGKGNSIYFIGCFSDNKNIYAFDFEDGSISISLPFPEVKMNNFVWTSLTLSSAM
ncbi:hypothetical protein V6N11_051477 [Hibiscus sabdariffa]|uniref:F-box domain-containing protein n=1 Tax=Hibiscus sabdariffa TaxID=183260 RepID=A0ABR2U758_9ROSI